ncbi:MAG TPA: (d)CMP kinase, partial [Lacunisphaera sp.]
KQHRFRGLVMEGRDIGSIIFPDADFRFFLFADPAERAKRRAAEGRQDAIGKRDTIDSQRLNQSAQGAIPIDSTHLTLEQVVDKMAALIATKLK